MLEVGLKLASRAVSATPAPRRYLLADVITRIVPLVAPRLLRRTEANFARVLGVPPRHPHARHLARASIQNFGRMAIDFLWVRRLDNTQVEAVTSLCGTGHLWEALRAGRGVILVLPHLGCWDVAAARASAAGLPITIVTEGTWEARLAAGSRARPGISLVPRGRSLRPLLRALARNEGVVLLSDVARPGIQTVDVPFFGHPAPLPVGPARLSLRTRAPIVALACARTGVGQYQLTFRPPRWPEAVDAAELTAHIAADFEALITAHLDQWYPVGRIWTE
jgi:KDO2-lipid IV(A) lauroyltransferase